MAQQENALQSITVADSEILEIEPVEETITQAETVEQSPVDKIEESIKRSIQATEEANNTTHVQPQSSDKLEDSIKRSIQATEELNSFQEEEVTPEVAENTIETTEEKLSIGKPLDFDKNETHSFAEWLQLSRLTPINRDNEEKAEPKEEENESPIAKKMELIDKFIETNPKIAPVKNNTPTPANVERSTQDSSMLMTETLARVYLEQKKYSKAIQAYEILILKYPEKSVFFADRISDIKIIQQNNNLKNDA
ncbi:tetratricopeptide repeat protein [Flavobacterium suzhouense]|uniref:Tetratricopeptide repeat protein n=1 Tax=Flavobacterium suzhouense TaxID=1529638 RepID=A0ABW5NV88_9FLAO